MYPQSLVKEVVNVTLAYSMSISNCENEKNPKKRKSKHFHGRHIPLFFFPPSRRICRRGHEQPRPAREASAVRSKQEPDAKCIPCLYFAKEKKSSPMCIAKLCHRPKPNCKSPFLNTTQFQIIKSISSFRHSFMASLPFR